MTGQEIYDKLEADVSVEALAWGDFDSEELGLGKSTEIHQQGGEGEGEHWESVRHFTDHNVYIKVVGNYQSYNGTEFYDGYGDVHIVTPQEKTITVYE